MRPDTGSRWPLSQSRPSHSDIRVQVAEWKGTHSTLDIFILLWRYVDKYPAHVTKPWGVHPNCLIKAHRYKWLKTMILSFSVCSIGCRNVPCSEGFLWVESRSGKARRPFWITGHSLFWVVVGGCVLHGHSSNELTWTKPWLLDWDWS